MGKTCENCIHFCVCVFRDGTQITASCCAFYEQNKRPHGEWVKEGKRYRYFFRCTNCNTPCGKEYYFCPNCGASMIPSNSEIEKSKSEIVPDYRDGWRLKEGGENG